MTAPKRFPDRDEVAAVRVEAEPLENGASAEETRRIAGRAMARREMGKLVFLDVVDRSGRIQAICDTAVTGDVEVHLGDVVAVVGKAAKSRRGEPSVLAQSVEILSRNTQPLPDTFHGLTDVELRYRKRFLDLLMNEETRDVFVMRARVVTAIRRIMDEWGFVEVETPVLQPRYGGAFARPFVTHHNELDADLYLRIATELYLKRLIVGGLERVYEIGKDFRNEGVSFKHNPEFTMLEWYEAYADYTDTMARIEQLVERVAREVGGSSTVTFRGNEIDLAGPWRRVTFVESLEAHAGADPADDRPRLPGRAVAVRPADRRRPDAHRAVRVLRRGDGARQRLHRDQRRGDAAGAVRAAVGAGGGRARRSRLCRGPLLRYASDGRDRPRHRPPRDAPHRCRVDPRRGAVSCVAVGDAELATDCNLPGPTAST